ncbi:hypothetical protein V3W47_16150 [Deinococcus sp. YIM 134068]|uniref:hypothetical protein n=1 Tax=Deinococcus lichenicola TaxID=3118910 RepID=UPI002F945D14
MHTYQISKHVIIGNGEVRFRFAIIDGEYLPCILVTENAWSHDILKGGTILVFSHKKGRLLFFKDSITHNCYPVIFQDSDVWEYAIQIMYERVLKIAGSNREFLVVEREVVFRKGMRNSSYEGGGRYTATSWHEAWLYAFCIAKFIAKRTLIKNNSDNVLDQANYYCIAEEILTFHNRVELHFKVYNNSGSGLGGTQRGGVEKYIKIYQVLRKYSPRRILNTYYPTDTAEKSEYSAGDPRLLRDSSNGQFGSYPSFEGDDEEE